MSSSKEKVPSAALLREWAKSADNTICWGLDAVADELESLRRDAALRAELEKSMADCIGMREGQTFEERAEELMVMEVGHENIERDMAYDACRSAPEPLSTADSVMLSPDEVETQPPCLDDVEKFDANIRGMRVTVIRYSDARRLLRACSPVEPTALHAAAVAVDQAVQRSHRQEDWFEPLAILHNVIHGIAESPAPPDWFKRAASTPPPPVASPLGNLANRMRACCGAPHIPITDDVLKQWAREVDEMLAPVPPSTPPAEERCTVCGFARPCACQTEGGSFHEPLPELSQHLRVMAEGAKRINRDALLHAAEVVDQQSTAPDADLTQYRCQPEKRVYCPHMDRVLAELSRAAQPPSVKHEDWCDQNCDCGANYRAPETKNADLPAPARENPLQDTCGARIHDVEMPAAGRSADETSNALCPHGLPADDTQHQCLKCGPVESL